MARTPLEELTCDRCGDRDIIGAADPEGYDLVGSGDPRRVNWAQLLLASLAGKVVIGGGEGGPADLCQSCANELGEWFIRGQRESKRVAAPPEKD